MTNTNTLLTPPRRHTPPGDDLAPSHIVERTILSASPSPNPDPSHQPQPAPAATRFRFASDAIHTLCETLPEHLRGPVKWAAAYCRERNLTHEDLGALLLQPNSDKPYSGDSIYAAFTGRRDLGSMERLATAIDTFRKRVLETAARATSPFITTNLAKQIFEQCEIARRKQRVVFLFGPSQIGKSFAASHYSLTLHPGETCLIRMPSGGRECDFLHEFAIRLGLGPNASRQTLRRRIIESFDHRMLLIIDECEQCTDNPRVSGLASLEFAREIHDRRKCGLLLIGAASFRRSLRSLFPLEKLRLRGYRPLQLPAAPSKADLDLFAKAFGLDPAQDKPLRVEITTTADNGHESTTTITGNPARLQADTIQDHGLGRWLSILEDASDAAHDRGVPNSWARVLATHHHITLNEA